MKKTNISHLLQSISVLATLRVIVNGKLQPSSSIIQLLFKTIVLQKLKEKNSRDTAIITLSSSFINSSIKLIEEFQIEKTREREKYHKTKNLMHATGVP